MATPLDYEQVIKATYDPINEALQVNVVAGGGGGGSSDNTVVDLFDTPIRDATTINGSGGALLQVVASLASAVKKIQCLDTSGEFIGVYTGPAASEVLAFVMGPGSDQTVEMEIASGTRVSLRSMSASAPTTGSLSFNFMG